MIVGKPSFKKNPSTSWENVAGWYDKSVGKEGHYYHTHVIFPKLFSKWKLKSKDSVIDLASGQGVVARQLPKETRYLGIEISSALIQSARKYDTNPHHQFIQGDITKELSLPEKEFSHATCILALQNLEDPLAALKLAAKHLKKGGKLALVINHPYFRIPRQSSWGEDAQKKLQYRRVDSYLSPLKIPITAHPGKNKEEQTLSYHFSLMQLTHWLDLAGFQISTIEEWCSDKTSTGPKAKMENRARDEFPLFMAIFADKA